MNQRSEQILFPKKWAVIAVLLFVVGLFLNLGGHPLFHEEPRRAMVAWEMLQNGNWFAPTIMGEFYYKKPPFFNWALALSYQTFGVNEWTSRWLSQLSFLLMGGLIFWTAKKYYSEQLGIVAALLFLASADLLFYFTVTGGEIDLFFSLLMLLFFLSLFHFGQQKQWAVMFAAAYVFAALGFLTKAMPALAALGLTLPVYLFFQAGWKKLFHWGNFLGIILFSLLIGGFLWMHSQQNPNGLQAFFQATWGDSAERTVAEKGWWKGLLHLLTFPLELWQYLLPGSLLLIFTWPPKSFHQLKAAPLIWFSVLVLMANLPIYWLSPGTRSRYLYLLFPFFMLIFGYLLLASPQLKQWQKKSWEVLILITIAAVGLACLILCFLPQLQFVNSLFLLMVPLAIACGFLFYGVLYHKWQLTPLVGMVLILGLAKIGHSATVLPFKSERSSQQTDKEDAAKIAEIVGAETLYVFKDTRFSYTTLYYLQLNLGETLVRQQAIKKGKLYLSDRGIVPQASVSMVLYEFNYREKKMVLFEGK